MKLKATIVGELLPTDKSIIVNFDGDKEGKHFEVFCSFNPHAYKMRKWDSWELHIKWDSEVFEDAEVGKKYYSTILKCDKATEIK